MWDELKRLSSIVVGQSIFSFLDLKNIVRLETALTNNEHVQTLRSFLIYFSKPYVELKFPKEITKLKWLQTHDFPIAKTVVHLDNIISTFETNMIHEIKLIGHKTITNTVLNYLLDS